jgi:hypothetical protein
MDELSELTVRARNVLLFAGINSKEQVKKLVEDDPLAIRRLYNCGAITTSEISAWAMVQNKGKGKNKVIKRAIAILENFGYTINAPEENKS